MKVRPTHHAFHFPVFLGVHRCFVLACAGKQGSVHLRQAPDFVYGTLTSSRRPKSLKTLPFFTQLLMFVASVSVARLRGGYDVRTIVSCELCDWRQATSNGLPKMLYSKLYLGVINYDEAGERSYPKCEAGDPRRPTQNNRKNVYLKRKNTFFLLSSTSARSSRPTAVTTTRYPSAPVPSEGYSNLCCQAAGTSIG